MTHLEYIKKHKPPQPCLSHHITFGGKCMNCGYDPSKKTK